MRDTPLSRRCDEYNTRLSVCCGLGVRSPVYVDGFDSRGVTRPEYVDQAMRQLEAKQVRYVVWPPRLNALGEAHLAAFHAYLETHYRRVRSFADQDEFWERLAPGE